MSYTISTPTTASALGGPAESKPCSITRTADGFSAHVDTNAQVLHDLRELTRQVLAGRCACDTVASAVVVLSELVANAVEACGAQVLLLVDVRSVDGGVVVSVTDPAPNLLPDRATTPLDSAEAESGRGLLLLELLCTATTIDVFKETKRIRCVLPA